MAALDPEYAAAWADADVPSALDLVASAGWGDADEVPRRST
ncbi:hypothetical protein [Streptomyces sp. NPDC049915]